MIKRFLGVESLYLRMDGIDLNTKYSQITETEDVDESVRDIIRVGLRTNHYEDVPEHYLPDGRANDDKDFDIIVRDADGQVQGGLIGSIIWKTFYINFLWLNTDLRGQGMGTELMQRAETKAIAEGCNYLWVKSYSFEAPDFYKKHGFRVICEHTDFPPDHTLYTLRKDL